jgi:dTDP-4-amino-4,6-dideoxygalactose transaminase
VPVHYAGGGCNDGHHAIAEKHGLFVIDAAQGMMSTFDSRPLGTIGIWRPIVFMKPKTHCGGEADYLSSTTSGLFSMPKSSAKKAPTAVFPGHGRQVHLVGIGSSYLPSELQAAYLWAN